MKVKKFEEFTNEFRGNAPMNSYIETDDYYLHDELGRDLKVHKVGSAPYDPDAVQVFLKWDFRFENTKEAGNTSVFYFKKFGEDGGDFTIGIDFNTKEFWLERGKHNIHYMKNVTPYLEDLGYRAKDPHNF